MIFPYFAPCWPLPRGDNHHLNKSESPSPKEIPCQVWLKSA